MILTVFSNINDSMTHKQVLDLLKSLELSAARYFKHNLDKTTLWIKCILSLLARNGYGKHTYTPLLIAIYSKHGFTSGFKHVNGATSFKKNVSQSRNIFLILQDIKEKFHLLVVVNCTDTFLVCMWVPTVPPL